jgi:N-acetylglutamate synthase-like GNAT family acetyltransferase
MFITRASRHDKSDLQEFYEANDWDFGDLSEGVAFIAREGKIIAAIRLIEVAPATVVIDDVLVKEDKRGTGLGRGIMQAAMNGRAGTLYLACHDDKIGFYERFGFALVDKDALPEAVATYLDKAGDLNPGPDHHHYFLKAR